MREILFRGKRIDNGEWVYGNLVRGCDEKYAYIVEFGNKELCRNYINVKPDTVGQYIGLTDKNGTRVFEGDILECLSSNPVGEVECRTIIVDDITNFETMGYLDFCNEIEVNGNIHDNPELRKR